MAHISTKALLKECGGATAKAIAQFRIAQRGYLSALGTLATHLGTLQRKTDEAEDNETHEGCLQRIEGIERQAHATQMHSAKARIAIRNMKGAVDELEIEINHLRNTAKKPQRKAKTEK